MITIKRNDYIKPHEIRESVVQDIIDAFLDGGYWSICHLCCDSISPRGRNRDAYVLKRNTGKAYGFNDKPFDEDDKSTAYHECEMREAFRILDENGYHIFKVRYYGTWTGYIVRKEDFYDGGTEVRDFTERWE